MMGEGYITNHAVTCTAGPSLKTRGQKESFSNRKAGCDVLKPPNLHIRVALTHMSLLSTYRPFNNPKLFQFSVREKKSFALDLKFYQKMHNLIKSEAISILTENVNFH